MYSHAAPRIRRSVGIDLGTTNSVIALLDVSTGMITGQDEVGRLTFPSVVGWNADQNRIVSGRAAQRLNAATVGEGPATLPLRSVKRFMGLDKRFTVGPESLSPEEASAHVLRLLRDMLARTLNDPKQLLDSAVITMPAYFNHNQIEATRQAGERAGFDVVELLHEPTAAAIYYSWVENHDDAVYLVYDLGGGTFDVSVIRRRLGDYEVLGVSGDPFLGGDDFDRLLASHLLEDARWTSGEKESQLTDASALQSIFEVNTAKGAANFARLVEVAEGVKVALSGQSRVERYVPGLKVDEGGASLAVEAVVERGDFDRLIKDKVDRTIDCCREALARAKQRAGVTLSEVDHVLLVGGASRTPFVRETVRAALCNAELPEHARCAAPLLHEPDLCVAYGAALRAAAHGTRYVFPVGVAPEFELHLTSPAQVREPAYFLVGRVGAQDAAWREGGSVRVRSLATGLTDEAFLDDHGGFVQDVDLQAEADNALELTVCDGEGREAGRVVAAVRCRTGSRALGKGVLPTQLITKPLQIEVLDGSRRRVKQMVAPVGAPLPGEFRCVCRTIDQAGKVVVPIFEENRVVKHMVLEDLDPNLPVGSPVEVEFAIDVKHNIEVRVRVRQGDDRGERCETARIETAAPPHRPTRAEIEEVRRGLDELLTVYSGGYRARVRSRADQLHGDLLEALRYDDEPKAIQRMAELRELFQQLEDNRGQSLDPPWPRFAQLVRQCLDLAAGAADATGRDREELFEHIHAQERYGEQAFEEQNRALYRECLENLEKYAGYLDQLMRDALPRPPAPPLPPEEEAKQSADRFRNYLAAVWKQVRAKQRADLETRLAEIAGLARGLTQRLKDDPHGVVREARRLSTEVFKVEGQMKDGRRVARGDDAGLLEGSV
jgi:molecular chaperone DnaK